MPKQDPAVTAHLEWLGFVRPIGLVVSAPALGRHGATLDRRDAEGHERVRACLPTNGDAALQPVLLDFRTFAANMLDWRFSPQGYAGTSEAPIPPELEVRLPDTGEVRPKLAVRKGPAGKGQTPASATPSNGAKESAWQLLVDTCEPATGFDRVARTTGGTDASSHTRMERLLRGTKKEPFRYRWPNEVRDEVLARLLELNAERAAQEGQG